ncbi:MULTISPECIES: hypothetical protein [unclassified Nonomuraea]|uniref:hypothetical protein n=1 Tax=unclassified Nonomuraea TaxID=2593643 RepID=UPI0034029968
MPVLVARGPLGLVREQSVRAPPGPVRVDPVVGLAAPVVMVALAVTAAVAVAPPVERSVVLLVGRPGRPRGSGRSWSGGRSPGWP